MKTWFDYIIVGSGPGGSVMAHELTRHGATCLMLEAGERYDPAAYPADELRANANLLWNGGMDLTEDASLVLLRGKVLGGGSVVNQCLLDRFDDLAWSDWQDKSGIASLNRQEMATHYAAVESVLTIQTIPRTHWNRNAQRYVEGFEKNGYGWAPLRRGQTTCSPEHDCIQCLGGCRRRSKQSMPETFLARAEQAGLKVETACQVERIHPGPGHVVVRARQHGVSRLFYGGKVVLAAGTLGTNEILLRSGCARRHPALGQGFYCHPQFMSLAEMPEIVDAHKGVFQAVKSDDERFRRQGFKLENVFAGPVAVAMLQQGLGREHQRKMLNYRRLACIEVAIRDVTPGQLSLDSDDRLRIRKRLGDEDRRRAHAGQQVIDRIFDSVGARSVEHSRLTIGLHLMGGAALGVDDRTSVVSPEFRLHHSPNVLVADGSLFPGAPGINPSLTIMALAHRAATIELKQRIPASAQDTTETGLKEVCS